MKTGIPDRVLRDFTRDLAMMLGARLRLTRCLRILLNQQRHRGLRLLLQQLLQRLGDGNAFAECLQEYPQVFSGFFVNLVRVGESTGELGGMLFRIAEYQEKMANLRRKLLQALSYPAMVVAVALLALGFILLYVLPTFESLFREFDAELPLITRWVMGISRFLQHYLLLMLAAVGVVGAVLWQLRHSRKVIELRDHILLKLPFAGSLLRRNYLAQFCRTLGTLLAAGIPLLKALRIASRVAPNVHFCRAVEQMALLTGQGGELASSLGRAGIFPDMVMEMIAVGEETAELPVMLLKIADIYDAELDRTIELLSSLAEPLMILLLGAIIGVILVSIYLPLFNMSTVIG